MLNLGVINKLVAFRQTDNGIYLVDLEENEVLLPNKYIPENMKLGDAIEVFIYKDSEDRIIATTLTPKVMLNQFASLKALSVNIHGAFFDWGLEKDLMVPHSQQAETIKVDKTYVVYMYLDEKSERLAGTTRLHHLLNKENVDLEVGEQVDLLAYSDTDLGIGVVVNETYQGIIYKNEAFKAINIGDRLEGYVKKIRDDNRLDISLNRFGYRAVEDHTFGIYQALLENDGKLPLNDKSSPKEISDLLGISKKVFKKALGALYKQRRIEITDEGIRLIEKKPD